MARAPKHALIVGAGDYLGGAIARRFARGGYTVCCSRRRGEGLAALVAEIEKAGGSARGFYSDARKEAEVKALFETIEGEMGPLEVVIFNPGGNVQFGIRETTTRVYRKVWEMGCFAGFLVGREAAQRMLPRGRGTILFTGATASMRGGAGYAAFAGAKHGLRALAQSMARELAPENIHVAHIVIDGMIDTAFTRERFPEVVKAKPKDGLLRPADIAETYWAIHKQKRSAWTHEADVRPWSEAW